MCEVGGSGESAIVCCILGVVAVAGRTNCTVFLHAEVVGEEPLRLLSQRDAVGPASDNPRSDGRRPASTV